MFANAVWTFLASFRKEKCTSWGKHKQCKYIYDGINFCSFSHEEDALSEEKIMEVIETELRKLKAELQCKQQASFLLGMMPRKSPAEWISAVSRHLRNKNYKYLYQCILLALIRHDMKKAATMEAPTTQAAQPATGAVPQQPEAALRQQYLAGLFWPVIANYPWAIPPREGAPVDMCHWCRRELPQWHYGWCGWCKYWQYDVCLAGSFVLQPQGCVEGQLSGQRDAALDEVSCVGTSLAAGTDTVYVTLA